MGNQGLSPLTRRRLHNFRANRRGWWSMWVFLILFTVSLFAEFVANDKPFVVVYRGEVYMPIFKAYPETTFGGDFLTEADYRDPFLAELIDIEGWMQWPGTFPFQRLRHPTTSTGSVLTIKPVMYWPGRSTAFGFQYCSALP